MTPQCSQCRFSAPAVSYRLTAASHKLQCHRYPPAVHQVDGRIFPFVSLTDWCGEFAFDAKRPHDISLGPTNDA